MSERKKLVAQRKWKQKRKRKNLYFSFCLFFAILIGIPVFGFSAKASSMSDSETAYKYYTSIQIEPGYSLWSIAEENYTRHFSSKKAYIREIKQINGLKNENLTSGQYLIIPYYSYDFIG